MKISLVNCQGPNLCTIQTELLRDSIVICFVSDFNILLKYIFFIKLVNYKREISI